MTHFNVRMAFVSRFWENFLAHVEAKRRLDLRDVHLLDAGEGGPHFQHAQQRSAVEDVQVRVRQIRAHLATIWTGCVSLSEGHKLHGENKLCL